eukprot:CAMPEP_0203672064 /NCGR_PEP_ID=MMETSP0090-20130426/7678_1 /ASSEMBLY_ACC=CAM_ASM_001088 /TAXON_ID=426623 /ORGANISM="Chaetoceros affinis, Strain CCMP159" /LENGTH=747 /DNA_ID=CAMNT_0050537295 /DNA_START=398 /DNA_END=2641 /DNA_ORIENTATION=-
MRMILSASFLKSPSTATGTTGGTAVSTPLSVRNTGFSFVVGFLFVIFFPLVVIFPLMSYAFRPSPTPSSSDVTRNRKFSPSEKQQQEQKRKKTINYSRVVAGQSDEGSGGERRNDENSNVSNNMTPPGIQGGFKNALNELSSMFEERSTQVRKILEDFSQPFVGFTRGDDYDYGYGNGYGDDGSNDNDSYGSSSDQLDTVVVEGYLGGTRGTGGGGFNITIEGNNDDEITTHFCFLVHGYRGKPADLLYLRTAMADTAEKLFSHNENETSPENSIGNNNNNDTDDELEVKHKEGDEDVKEEEEKKHGDGDASSEESQERRKQRIVLHSCRSNWNNTSDGVEAGGDRIFNEILGVIRNSMENQFSGGDDGDGIDNNDTIVDVTVSLIGNSLGGLYSRYALKRLAEFSKEQCLQKDSNSVDGENTKNETDHKSVSKVSFLIDGKIRVHFNTFCTTATPHLGVSGHTYLPLPRSAELGIGSLMGQTGRDIFRMSPLIKSMCTEDSFLKPLSSFRKRIAYANGYHTDFVVSTKTAAFLHPESKIPHRMSDRFLTTKDNDKVKNGDGGKGLVVATLYTQPSEVSNSSNGSPNEELMPAANNTKKRLPKLLRTDSSVKEDLLEMSSAMDQLGWKKVIVDLRNEMPMKLPMPKPRNILPRIVKKFSSEISESQNELENDKDKAIEFSPTSRKILESRDVDQAFSIPDDFIGFPLGHNTMVAVAQSRLTFVFKGGRPLMDKLAVEMIDEILSFNK